MQFGLRAIEDAYELWRDAHKSVFLPPTSKHYVDPSYLGIDIDCVPAFIDSLTVAKIAVEKRQVQHIAEIYNELIRRADGLAISVKYRQWEFLSRAIRILQDVSTPGEVLYLPPAIARSHADAARGVRKNPAVLDKMTPREFEEMVAGLFHLRGFEVALTPKSRDRGFDVIAIHRLLDVPFKWIVECKQYTRRLVTAPAVQNLFGAAIGERADRALVVTTSGFKRDAVEFARRNPALQLWARHDLFLHLSAGAA